MKIRYSLSLDCNPISKMPLEKVEDFLAELEEECVKIDAFKWELPISVQLLKDAIDFCKQHLGETNGEESFSAEKKENWLKSVQLWTQPNEAGANRWRTGGAFLPFSKVDGREKIEVGTDLVLAPVQEEEVEEKTEKYNNSDVDNSAGDGRSKTRRKERRCWSPDLHRRFVNALHILGGSNVATPKQIREIMKVDGLTNDEVKSHLQKYRLHTRSSNLAPTTVAMPMGGQAQLLVLGGVWVPPHYSTSATVYDSRYSVSRGFYPSPQPAPDGNDRYVTRNGEKGTVEFDKDGGGEKK